MSIGLETRLLACALSLWSLLASADVYTYIDANGNRVFTDQPRKHAQRVQIAPSNSMSGAPPARSLQPRQPQAAPAAPPLAHYQLLRILTPEPDSAVSSTSGDVLVTVTSEPPLQAGHLYRLMLDGQAIGEPGRSPVFALHNIDRGTHQLSVEIFDAWGRVVEKTPNQPFHLQRITLAQKRAVRPCKVEDYGVRLECPLKDKPEEEVSILPFF